MTDRELMQQALEALEAAMSDDQPYIASSKGAITALRERLAETGSCIACGNRMTRSPESFVVATAEVGATAPEGYSPQQVEALHPHKGRDKTSPPFAEPEQEPVAWMAHQDKMLPTFHRTFTAARDWAENPTPLYTTPPQRKPLTDEEIGLLTTEPRFSHIDTPTLAAFARAVIAKATGEKE